MSSPQVQQLHEMIERFLRQTAGNTLAQAAASLGVHESYVSKLRRGWRPDRVRGDLIRNLTAALASAPRGGVVREASVSFGGDDYARGVVAGELSALREMMRWIVQRQAELGARAGVAQDPPSPTVDEVEDAAAVLSRLPVPESPPAKKRRRA